MERCGRGGGRGERGGEVGMLMLSYGFECDGEGRAGGGA